MTRQTITPEFVEFIPEQLEDGKLYISETYSTAVHKCCCGCGQKVVTPLRPTDWKLHVRGGRVSLHPSIGNWGFPCRSHYWIRHNRVQWSYEMSQEEIDEGRRKDAQLKQRQYDTFESTSAPAPAPRAEPVEQKPEENWWQKLKRRFNA